MSEDRSNRAAMDPMALWRQWYETSTKMWSDMFGGARESYMDPYGLYRQWFKNLESLWGQMAGSTGTNQMSAPFAAMMKNSSGSPLAAPFAAMNPATAIQGSTTTQTPAEAPATAATMGAAEAQNLWKQLFEATLESWRKAGELGAVAVDLTPRWMETLEHIRHNFFSAEGVPSDPLQFATRWYNATSGPLSEFVGDLMEREEVLEPYSQILHNYASFYRVFKRDSEEYLKNLSVPVRSDIERVAGLVVALEDKIDGIEDALEDLQDSSTESTTAESLASIEERIGRLESSLENVQSGTEGAATADSVSNLEGRLDDVEAKIDRLLATLENASQNGGAQNGATQTGSTEAETTSQSEDSQDESAAQADGSAAQEEEVRATAAARRKAEELSVDLTEVEGTGSNGQITVDDVRRANAQG